MPEQKGFDSLDIGSLKNYVHHFRSLLEGYVLVLGKQDCKALARAFGYRMSDWSGEGLQCRDCMLTIVTRCVSDTGSAK